MSTPVTLKPCPFCGASVELKRHPGNYGYTEPSVSIRCECGRANTAKHHQLTEWVKFEGHHSIEKEAIQNCVEEWNERVTL